MVHEREPPRTPGPAPQNNDKSPIKHMSQPVFGQPSPLGAQNNQRKGNPFIIPKANKPRPEHHQPPQRTQGQQHGNSHRPSHGPMSTIIPGPRGGGQRYQGYDPLRPVKPSEYNKHRPGSSDDDSVVEIVRPGNVNRTTQPAPIPMFASPTKPKMSKQPSSNLQAFIDLTGSATNSRHFDGEEFGAMDAYSYVDAAKANENIKALLEGAFEDESDKPRTRQRKKKIEDKVNDLASKLQKVDVGGAAEEEDGEEEEEEDDGAVEGLKVKLLPHQREGVDWMRDKEAGVKKTRGVLPKGGILADDMGLGKTVQTIALLLTNPRYPKEKEVTDDDKEKKKNKVGPEVGKGTLVVAPLALIKQWESELESKVEASHRLRTCVYHGAQRTKNTGKLDQYDVVITTYGTLSSEHANSEKKPTGCFASHWYRIILDEAHTIKNRNAKATQAACALKSEYRWCLTGTPMQNNLNELQSLINFLRIKPYNDLAAWRDQITKPLNNGRGGLAIRRLQVYLKAFMKRRTKDVLKLDGGLGGKGSENDKENKQSSQGFKITNREVLKVEAEFTPAERAFYQRLEQRTDKTLERMIGGDNLNYASALVLLLRLRQACNHPDLVKSDLAQDKDVLMGNLGSQSKASKDEEDVDSIANLMGGLSVVTKLCDVCQTELSAKEVKSGVSRCAECEAELKTDALSPRKKGDKKKKKTKKFKQKKEKKQKSTDRASAGEPSEARRARLQKQRIVIDSDDEDEDGEWLVPEDQRGGSLGKACGIDDEDAEGGGDWLGSDDSETDENKDVSRRGKRAPEVINLESDEDSEEDEEDDDDDETDDDESDENDSKPKTPDHLASTKIRHLMKILKKESGDYKFIVFSFFTSMLNKIEPFLKDANIGYARYDGAMRNDLRENSLDRLRNAPKTRVLLCSLRAGSLGLNLTAASRVVILEPFWNPFVEEQAIDRVHRLNQTIDVKIYKVTVKNTVEERIVDLQERKRELANATIEGKTSAAKLTMKDMMALFSHDANARYSDDDVDRRLDLTGKTRLLGNRDDDDYGSVSTSQQGKRATPPIMERKAGNSGRRTTPESSVYGRRW